MGERRSPPGARTRLVAILLLASTSFGLAPASTVAMSDKARGDGHPALPVEAASFDKVESPLPDGDAHKQNFMVRKFLLPDSSDRLLTPEDLNPLSCSDLWVARNEIFFRNGYCFKEGRGRDYFGEGNCQYSRIPPLSRLETRNIELVRRIERQKRCRGRR